jgi:hypothetical protein
MPLRPNFSLCCYVAEAIMLRLACHVAWLFYLWSISVIDNMKNEDSKLENNVQMHFIKKVSYDADWILLVEDGLQGRRCLYRCLSLRILTLQSDACVKRIK